MYHQSICTKRWCHLIRGSSSFPPFEAELYVLWVHLHVTQSSEVVGTLWNNRLRWSTNRPDDSLEDRFVSCFSPARLLATSLCRFQINPQPEYSAYREPSFGHGTLEIFNKTTALFKWHRNQDKEAVTADYVYLSSLQGVDDCSEPSQQLQPVYNGSAQKFHAPGRI